MTNDIAITESMSVEELMALTGQDNNQFANQIPNLRINTDASDDDGNQLPVGTFTITTDKGVVVYAKSVLFRPYINVFQYQVYDQDLKKFTNRSIMFKRWDDEKYDELGGFACGKLSQKDRKVASKEVLEVQKTIKTYRCLYGTVTFVDGVDKAGKKVAVVDVPCMLRVRGSNFMPIGEIMEKLSKQGKVIFHHDLSLGLRREKNGTTIYYVIEPTVAKGERKFDAPAMENFRLFTSLINELNDKVIAKFKDARKSSVDVSKDEAIVKTLDGEFIVDSVEDIG